MRKISIKKLKYDEIQALKQYLEIGISNNKISIHKAEESTILAITAELYVKLTKKLLFVDKSKLQSLSLTTSEAMGVVAYTQNNPISDNYIFAIISGIKQTILKQLA